MAEKIFRYYPIFTAFQDDFGSPLTSWWNGKNNAGYIDFTKSEAVAWWVNRLEKLQKATGIDSFKFDAGEVSWMPENVVDHSNSDGLWPNLFTTE